VNYGDLRGGVVSQLLALFKIRNIVSEAAAVHRLALVRIVDPINGGRFHIPNRHIRVANRINGRDMRIVSIGAVIGPAQVIPSGEKQLIVNHRIDLRMFNEIYSIILSSYVQYLFGRVETGHLRWQFASGVSCFNLAAGVLNDQRAFKGMF